MNSFDSSYDGRRVALENATKRLEDFPAIAKNEKMFSMTDDDFFARLSRENETLRSVNQELHEKVNTINQRLADMRAQPIKIETSPEQTAKILRLESDKERLLIQLKEKTELLEEAKLKLNDKRDSGSMEAIINNIRKELNAQYKQEYDAKVRKYLDNIDSLQKELNESKLFLTSKDREIDVLEQNLKSMERRTLEEMEGMRNKISEALWTEYEKKLNAKKEEFDKRCELNLAEIEKLAAGIKEWRKKCIELEDKNSKLQNQIHSSADSDLDLKRMISNYENRISSFERDIERCNQINSDQSSQLTVLRERIKLQSQEVDDANSKRSRLEESLIEKEAQAKALAKEIDRLKTQSNAWVAHIEKVENENSRNKMRVIDLENTLKSIETFKDSDSKELTWEKANSDRLNGEIFNLQSVIKTLQAKNASLEDQMQKMYEEIGVKNSLLEEFKKVHVNMNGSFDGFMKDNARLKSANLRDQDRIRALEELLTRMESDRKDLLFKIEAERSKNGPRGMINSTAHHADLESENFLLKKRLEDLENENRSTKAKLSQISNKTAEIVEDSTKLVEENSELYQRNKEQDQKIASLETEITQLKLLNEKLSSEKEHAEKELNLNKTIHQISHYAKQREESDEEKYRQTQIENGVLRNQIEELQRQNKQLVEQSKGLVSTDQAYSLKNAIEKLTEENASLSQQLLKTKLQFGEDITQLRSKPADNSQTDQIKALGDLVSKIQIEKEELSARNQKLQEENERLKSQIIHSIRSRDSEIQGPATSSATPALISQLTSLKSRNVKVIEENKDLREAISMIEKSSQDLLNENNALKDYIKKSLASPEGIALHQEVITHKERQTSVGNSKADHDVASMKNSILHLENYVSQLVTELEHKDLIIKELQSGAGPQNKAFTQSENDYLKAYIEKLTAEHTSLRQNYNYLLEEVGVLKSDNVALSEQIQQFLKDKSQRSSRKEEKKQDRKMSETVQELNEENKNLSEELKRLFAENRDLQTRNHELQKSVVSHHAAQRLRAQPQDALLRQIGRRRRRKQRISAAHIQALRTATIRIQHLAEAAARSPRELRHPTQDSKR